MTNKKEVLALILAGGKGSRLEVLTDARAKPALPFGGSYRLIDVPLSNLTHSGMPDVWLIEQYRPHWLNEYLAGGRPWDLDRTRGGFRVLPPFEGRDQEGFAKGNAEALHQHVSFLREYGADLLLVLSADHLYRLDYRDIVEQHIATEADLTMVTTKVTKEEASRFGVVETDDGGRVTDFAYKPDEPQNNVVTAEVFLFNADTLLDTLDELAEEGELEDYGDQLIPHLVEQAQVYAFPLDGYWRDVGTVESYWEAHRDLLDEKIFQLDDPEWSLLTGGRQRQPARIAEGATIKDSLVSQGCAVHGTLERSVLAPGVVVERGASVQNSVVLEDVVIRAGAQVRNAVLDKGVEVGQDAKVGGDGDITLVGMDVKVEEGATVKTGEHLEPQVEDKDDG